MKFSEHLGSHLTPEWRTQYVKYDEMKEFLYAAATKVPEIIDEEVLKLHVEKYDDAFFNFCDNELKKVNTFFAEKLAEASRKFNSLEVDIANAGVERLKGVATSSMLYTESDDQINKRKGSAADAKKTEKKNKKKLSNMKFVVGEFYLSLVMIQNFQKLNFTAFRKILKKHDKIFKTTTGAEYRIANVETAYFNVNKDVEEIITNTETIAIEDLENGNRTKAMKRLRVPPLEAQEKSGPHFYLGLFIGMCVILFLVLAYQIYDAEDSQFPICCTEGSVSNNSRTNISNSDDSQVERWTPAFRMYRGFFIILIMFCLLGVNVYGWQHAGVNHVLIFGLDPRHHLVATEFLMIGSFLGFVWALSCLAFVLSRIPEYIPVYANPGAFACFLVLFFLNPTRTFWYRSRRWLLNVLFRIICAPLFPVKFADFWLADQLNSLVVSLRDFEYLLCFYAYDLHLNGGDCKCRDSQTNFMRPFVTLLPAWFRFAQCLRRYYDTRQGFPHLVNGGKYFASIMVTVFSTIASIYDSKENFSSPFTIIWVICLVISTIFSLIWDLRMDWGMFTVTSGENRFLRDQIVYNHKIYYYLAIVANTMLRILKPLTVSVVNSGFLNHELFNFFLSICEVFRRFIWNFFRLENEHLNNCGEFRAVRDISITNIEMYAAPMSLRRTKDV